MPPRVTPDYLTRNAPFNINFDSIRPRFWEKPSSQWNAAERRVFQSAIIARDYVKGLVTDTDEDNLRSIQTFTIFAERRPDLAELLWRYVAPDLAEFPGSGTTEFSVEDIASEIARLGASPEEIRTITNIINSIISRTSTTVTGQETIRRTRFIEVPTPEHFLNEFQNALRAQLNVLLAEGQISFDDAQLILDPSTGIMNTLLDEYLGVLGKKALAGEPLFDIPARPTSGIPIGSRSAPGGEQSQITTKTEGTSKQTSEQTGSTTTIGGVGGTTQQQTKTTTEQNINTEQQVKRDVKQELIEEFRVVPSLDLVFRYSPTKFLSDRFKNPGELLTFARAIQGRRRRTAATVGTGGPISTAQRVG